MRTSTRRTASSRRMRTNRRRSAWTSHRGNPHDYLGNRIPARLFVLEVPVLDRKGHIRHDGGVVDSPGMYLMGMQFLRRRKSALIDGAGDDAHDLSEHLVSYLDGNVPEHGIEASASEVPGAIN